MNQIYKIVLGFIVLGAAATTVFADSVCKHVDIEWIGTHIPLPDNAKMVLKRENGQLCEVILNINDSLVPVYAGKDFIFAGQLFKNGRSITRETMKNIPDVVDKEKKRLAQEKALKKENLKSFFKKNINALEQFVFQSFKPEQAMGFFYVVTDPDCSQCRDLLPKLELAALDSGMEVKVILYPVLGARSRDMAAQAVCNKYSYRDYTEIELIEPESSCEQADLLFARTEAFFRSAGIDFVPLVLAGDGSWMVDANDIRQVRTHLGLETGEDENSSGKSCSAVSGY
ncbi:MAG: hypothetical protein GY737_08950 [Desulfobacteraceae bacterium]|nr:hypothetical protein [Desulfobacteraceae bacterium]